MRFPQPPLSCLYPLYAALSPPLGLTFSHNQSPPSLSAISPLHPPHPEPPLILSAPNHPAPAPTAAPSFPPKRGLLAPRALGGPTMSPTDNVLSPCSAKLSGAKQRHFQKCVPLSLILSLRKGRGLGYRLTSPRVKSGSNVMSQLSQLAAQQGPAQGQENKKADF